MHPFVYWKINIEKANMNKRICLVFLKGSCIVDYAFKITTNNFPLHVMNIH